MSLIASCADCGKKYQLSDGKAGKKFRCGACGAIIEVPVAEGEPDFWDLPPAEDQSELPLSTLPPRAGSRSSGAAGSKKSRSAPSSGRGVGYILTTLFLVLGVIGGLTTVGLGGYLLVDKLFLGKGSGTRQSAGGGGAAAGGNWPVAGEDGKPIKCIDLTHAKSDEEFGDFLTRYKGQTVGVRGVCSNFHGDLGKQSLMVGRKLNIIYPDRPNLLNAVSPVGIKDQSAPMNTVLPGQTVIVRGIADGGVEPTMGVRDGNVVVESMGTPASIREADVLKVEGDPIPQVTDVEIAQAHETHSTDEFVAKYTLPKCIFTGKLTRCLARPEDLQRKTLTGFEISMSPSPKLRISSMIQVGRPNVDASTHEHAVDPTTMRDGATLKMIGSLNWRGKYFQFGCERILAIENVGK